MNNIGSYIFIVFFAVTIIFSICKKRNVFSDFTEGALKGLKTTLDIFPSVLALIIAVNMFTASGLSDYISNAISPLMNKIGIPAEVIPLCIITPFSGSGSLSVFENILSKYGSDSYIGRVASVITGSTETTFFAVTVYFGSIGIKKTRHTVFSSLCANLASFLIASLMVKLFFYK